MKQEKLKGKRIKNIKEKGTGLELTFEDKTRVLLIPETYPNGDYKKMRMERWNKKRLKHQGLLIINQKFSGKDFEKVKEELPNKGIRTKNKVYKGKVRVGKEKETDKPVFVTLEINKIDRSTETIFERGTHKIIRVGNDKETIYHNRVSEYYTVSFTGEVGYYDFDSFGQIKGIVRDCEKKKPKKAEKLLDYWDRYHLNEMNAKCVHQMKEEKCPDGYKEGTKWLVEPISKGKVDELIEFFEEY